jgi:N-acetylneuraminate synthase
MVSAIRDTETVLGSGEKRVLDVEEELYEMARRAVHAVRDIDAGEVISEADVKVLRPGEKETGLDPKFYDEVVGETAVRSISEGDGIQWEDIRE